MDERISGAAVSQRTNIDSGFGCDAAFYGAATQLGFVETRLGIEAATARARADLLATRVEENGREILRGQVLAAQNHGVAMAALASESGRTRELMLALSRRGRTRGASAVIAR